MIDVKGRQTPFMNTGGGNLLYLSNLAIGQMGKSTIVKREIEEIKKVTGLQKEKHFLGYSESLSLDVEREETLVYDSLGNVFFDPYQVPTIDVLDLLERWHDFLLIYESGGIPGLTNSLS